MHDTAVPEKPRIAGFLHAHVDFKFPMCAYPCTWSLGHDTGAMLRIPFV